MEHELSTLEERKMILEEQMYLVYSFDDMFRIKQEIEKIEKRIEQLNK